MSVQFRLTVSDEMLEFLEENYTGKRPDMAKAALRDARFYRELARRAADGVGAPPREGAE